MHSITDFQIAVSKEIPEALVIIHSSEHGLRFQRGSRLTMVPEFVVSRGFILGEGPAPTQEPALSDEAELDVNVRAVVAHQKNIVREVVAQSFPTPLRTIISINERSPIDGIRLGIWVY